MTTQDGRTLPKLWAVMEKLLAPDGCAWDRAQTPESLRNFVLEEAHEVVDAIDGGDVDELREELGDLLFQVVFLAAIAQRRGWFGLDDVVAGIADKLERRHPHVFGPDGNDRQTQTAKDWEALKRQEKGERPLLGGIPASLPALLRAYKVGQRAGRVGLDFAAPEEARGKVLEELNELDEALARNDRQAAERELGDLLFSVVNWARLHQLDAESGLRGAVQRFAQRVGDMEVAAKRAGHELRDMSQSALDSLWEQIKGLRG